MRHTIFAILLLLSAVLHAQQTFRGRVVDAETGEPLPYVIFKMIDKRGTLSNVDGYYVLYAEPSDKVTVSFVGYEPQIYKAKKLPDEIRMKPLTSTLTEVKPIPIENIMLKFIKKLNKENSIWANYYNYYFFRQRTSNPDYGEVVVEAFFWAFSSININHPRFVNGRKYYAKKTERVKDSDISSYTQSNIHHLLCLSPEVPLGGRNRLTERLNFPLPEWATEISDLEGRTFTCTEIISEKGDNLYKVDIRVDPKRSAEAAGLRPELNNIRLSSEHALSGTMYIKKKNLHLVSFDGKLEGYYAKEYYTDGEMTTPVNVRIHIDYTHRLNFTEPISIHCTMKYGNKKTHFVAFKVATTHMIRRMKILWGMEEDMIETIDSTGYKEKIYKEDIILRSQKEEEIVRKAMETDSIR